MCGVDFPRIGRRERTSPRNRDHMTERPTENPEDAHPGNPVLAVFDECSMEVAENPEDAHPGNPVVHLNSFKAVRYRGIDGLTLPRMSKANLITGANGIGKTALLEAMWLFTGRYNPGLLWSPNVQRFPGPTLNPISRLTDSELELHGEEKGGHHEMKFIFEKTNRIPPMMTFPGGPQEYTKNIPVEGFIHVFLDKKRLQEKKGTMDFHPAPTGNVVLYLSPTAPTGRPGCVFESAKYFHETPSSFLQRYSNLVREGRKKDLVKAIKMVAESVEDVEILTDGKESYLSGVIRSGKLRPLHDLGDGAFRLVRLLLHFSTSRNAMLLSDELENGIHHTAHRKLWDSARLWMDQWNVQFVATTHSGELIDAAMDAFADDTENLAIHNLFRDGKTGRIEVATYTGESLAGARDLNLEVR